MKVIGVIPARWASTRFPGKPLAEILDKPMIQHVYEAASKSKLLEKVVIATDDKRIYNKCVEFDADVMMTDEKHPSGTDKVAEVAYKFPAEIYVNIQGDEPMIKGIMIDNLITALLEDDEAQMATLVKKIKNKDEISNPNVVKVVLDKKGYALYFSRSTIPCLRDQNDSAEFYKHIGLYAYTKDFLFTYTNLPSSKLEHAEKLEQLRALEHGFKIKTVETEFDTIGIDTPEDLEKFKKILESERKL